MEGVEKLKKKNDKFRELVGLYEDSVQASLDAMLINTVQRYDFQTLNDRAVRRNLRAGFWRCFFFPQDSEICSAPESTRQVLEY